MLQQRPNTLLCYKRETRPFLIRNAYAGGGNDSDTEVRAVSVYLVP
jgi:hypothetical protein